MKNKLNLAQADLNFNLDWLLRSLNTVLAGEAKFSHSTTRRRGIRMD